MKHLKTFSPLIASLAVAAILLTKDFPSFIAWWAVWLGLGIIFFPMSSVIFARLQSKGYIFSKVIGLAIGGYLTWLASSFKILPFRWWAAYLVLAYCLGMNILVGRKAKPYSSALKDEGLVRNIIMEEALFIALLAFWSYLRGMKPDIIGLEKFMDFGIVNSALRGDYFPPVDMWYAGKPINYYYLGQYFSAYLTRLSFVDSAITYNLMMATLFAAVFMLAYSIGQFLYELYAQNALLSKRSKFARTVSGILPGALVCLSGSLHTVIYAWFAGGGPYGFYWFPDATRYIGFNPPVPEDGTIHEFPLYSFVVSDLHAHVINMLFVLTAVGAAIACAVGIMKRAQAPQDPQGRPARSWKDYVPEPSYFLVIFLIGLFPATNYWDFPIYIVVSGAIYFYANLKARKFSLASLGIAFVQVAVAAALSYIVVLPFQMGFEAISSEIEFVTIRSRAYQLIVLYGYQVVFFSMLLAEAVYSFLHPPAIPKTQKRMPKFQLERAGELTLQTPDTEEKKNVVIAFLERANPADVIAGILFVCAIGLVILPEIIYIKDIYPNNPRANTMFKLCYQAFILFSLGIGYTFPRLFMHGDKRRPSSCALCALAATLLFCAFIYPFYAIKGWYGSFSTSGYKGLNGTAYMETYLEKLSAEEEAENELSMVDDMPIIEYLNKVKGQPAICEANDLSYTSFGRVASATGLPDIFNWYTHQQLWRNSKHDEFNTRVLDVETVYTSGNVQTIASILAKYNVEYIVVGKLERKKYGDRLNEDAIKASGEMVVESNGTYLIKLS
jgi:YYY domain-containing protein